jgi:hypothetical protein
MMIHISASAPINIFGLDEFTTATRTRNHLHNDRLAMKCHVTRAAKCESIRHIKTEIRELRIRLDMVRRQSFLCLVAHTPTMLASIGIAFKHSLTPSLVFRRLESLPWFATFPFIVSGPTILYGALLQTFACLT